MFSTKLTVPAGTFAHVSAGDTCSPAWVYLSGITPPSGNAVVVSVRGGAAGAAAGACPATAVPPGSSMRGAASAASIVSERAYRIVRSPGMTRTWRHVKASRLTCRSAGRRRGRRCGRHGRTEKHDGRVDDHGDDEPAHGGQVHGSDQERREQDGRHAAQGQAERRAQVVPSG